jgi:hypothetical protein
MNLKEIIANGIAPFSQYRELENGVSLSTHCLYPSHASVQVFVRGAGDSFYVSDGGGAIRDAETSGAVLGKSDTKFLKLIQKQGLVMKNGVVGTEAIPIDMVPAAVLLVANASKEVADFIFSTWRVAKARDFKELVREYLVKEFPRFAVKEERLIGESHKPHAFESVVHLPSGRRLIVDPVLRDSNSINARVVANLDIHLAKLDGVMQRIVYNDADGWPANDLSVLDFSRVPRFAFSKANEALRPLLAA